MEGASLRQGARGWRVKGYLGSGVIGPRGNLVPGVFGNAGCLGSRGILGPRGVLAEEHLGLVVFWVAEEDDEFQYSYRVYARFSLLPEEESVVCGRCFFVWLCLCAVLLSIMGVGVGLCFSFVYCCIL